MKQNRTNPLDEIEFWFTSLPEEMQKQIVKTANHFHVSEDVYLKNTLKSFLSYLDSFELNERQIIARTIFMKGLLDVAFAGKETDDDWLESLDRLLLLRERVEESGGSTELEDEAIASHETTKAKWMNIISGWRSLEEEYLTNKKILDWYFAPALNRNDNLGK